MKKNSKKTKAVVKKSPPLVFSGVLSGSFQTARGVENILHVDVSDGVMICRLGNSQWSPDNYDLKNVKKNMQDLSAMLGIDKKKCLVVVPRVKS